MIAGKHRSPVVRVAMIAGVIFVTILIFAVSALLIFADSLANVVIGPRITEAFVEAFPGSSIRVGDTRFSLLQNRLTIDSVTLQAVDGTVSGTIGKVSVEGVAWISLLLRGEAVPEDAADVVGEVGNVRLYDAASRNIIHCERLNVSVPDSELVADALVIRPPAGDEHFFEGSPYRSTRYRLSIPQCRVTGLACLALLTGGRYSARSVDIEHPVLDVLINKDKPSTPDANRPDMPGDMLQSMKGVLLVDALRIDNGELIYSERWAVGGDQARISFDSMQIHAKGIASRAAHDAVIEVEAQLRLANAGTMNVHMLIPINAPGLSLSYTGSLSGMDLGGFNSFLEVSDQMRIKSGVLGGVIFDVSVSSGRAGGSVRGTYKGLKLASIDKQTGSESGLSNGVISFLANNLTIRRNNLPDSSGSMKTGEVKYTIAPDDTFVQVVWYSLRTGIRDVVGF